jgi:glycosyltransferase involved in cell wall biosynthesis
MKVLHVVAALAERYGGPSRNVVGLCAATRALGVDAEICATNADGPGGCLDVPSDERIVWHGVPVRFFRRTWSETYKYSAPLSGWLRSRVQDFDLIVTHGCFSFAPEAAAVAAWRAGVPYLVVPHGMLAEWALTRRRKQVHLRLRTRTLVRAARGFICT